MGYQTLIKRLISEISPYLDLGTPWHHRGLTEDDDSPIPARALCMSWAFTATFLNEHRWEMSDKIKSKEGDTLDEQVRTLKGAMLACALDDPSGPIPPPEVFRQDRGAAHNLRALLTALVDVLRQAKYRYDEFSREFS